MARKSKGKQGTHAPDQKELSNDFFIKSNTKPPALTTETSNTIPSTSYSSSSSSSINDLKPEFTAEDFTFLAQNEHFRYDKNSKRVGHVVITKDQKGDKIGSQYLLPAGNNADTPTVCQLTDVEVISRYGQQHLKAKGPELTNWYSRRSEKGRIKLNDEEDDAQSVEIAYFSEEEKKGKEPFWGSTLPAPRVNPQLSDTAREEVEAELAEIGVTTKGGGIMTVDEESIRFRDANPNRNPDQNTVMGRSARDAYEEFSEQYNDVLSDELKRVIERAFKANIHKYPENQYRPEWLHLFGFSLTPANMDPQKENNLGAAGKCYNTEMMVLERLVKWFTLHKISTKATIQSLFTMLFDSDLVNHIHFEVNIEVKNRFVRFVQELDTLKRYPIFRKASDLAQLTGVSYALLHQQEPLIQQKIIGAPTAKKGFEPQKSTNTAKLQPVLAATNSNSNKQTAASSSFAESNTTIIDEINSNLVESSTSNQRKKTKINTGVEEMSKNKYNTYFKQEKSLVQIFTDFHEPEYEEPWLGTHVKECTGTGLVIEHEGEHYVLTNAHCVENQVRVRVRLANSKNMKYEAEPICVSYQCDLALLKIDNRQFQEESEPVELGEMVNLKDKVLTIGFPMGGNEISITKGIASRIEVRDYCMSGLDMLQVQVDAAINPGNSGGPVFSNGKVVGVAFQGYSFAQGLGYIIPMPIVRHFLNEVFSGKKYRGFPILTVEFDTLENETQRSYHGLQGNQSGILINKIGCKYTDASKKLKAEDVLLKIDGLVVSNKGTVDIPGIGNCIDILHVTHMKNVGDSVRLEVLRKNTKGQFKTHEIDVLLEYVPLETEVVPQTEYDKMPTYYINSGLVFVPVTANYLEGPGSDLEELTFIDNDPNNGSYSIRQKPKSNPDEQFVAINTVLIGPSTEGYEGYTNSLIYSANGKRINNLKELITNLESNLGLEHHIVTKNGTKIVIKNLNQLELTKIMKNYKIQFDRSEDLRNQTLESALDVFPEHVSQLSSLNENTKHTPPGSSHIRFTDDEDDSDDQINYTSKAVHHSQPVKQLHTSKRLNSDIDSLEDTDEEEAITHGRVAKGSRKYQKTAVNTLLESDDEIDLEAILNQKNLSGGARHYFSTLQDIERRAEENQDDEEDDLSWENDDSNIADTEIGSDMSSETGVEDKDQVAEIDDDFPPLRIAAKVKNDKKVATEPENTRKTRSSLQLNSVFSRRLEASLEVEPEASLKRKR